MGVDGDPQLSGFVVESAQHHYRKGQSTDAAHLDSNPFTRQGHCTGVYMRSIHSFETCAPCSGVADVYEPREGNPGIGSLFKRVHSYFSQIVLSMKEPSNMFF